MAKWIRIIVLGVPVLMISCIGAYTVLERAKNEAETDERVLKIINDSMCTSRRLGLSAESE